MANGWYQPTKALFSSVPTSGYGLTESQQRHSVRRPV